MKNALVIGADGTIGSVLYAYLKSQNIEVQGTTRRIEKPADKVFLDLSLPPETWPRFSAFEVAFICAGAGRLDICEKKPAETRQVNVAGTIALAKQLQQSNIFSVFISTNQVFDGQFPFRKVHDPTCPISEYGRQKAEAEKILLHLPNAAILRSSKIISQPFPLFEQWRNQWLSGQQVKGIFDLYSAPVPIAQIIEALIYIGTMKQSKMYQISGVGDISFYELACLYAKSLGVSHEYVIKATAESNSIPANFNLRHPTLLKTGLDHIIVLDPETIVRRYMDAATTSAL